VPRLAVLPPPPLEVTALAWDRDTAGLGEEAILAIAALHWRDRYATLAALREEADSTFTPLPLDSLGLPETLALDADTTRLPWTARWLRGGPDTTRALRFVVRTADSSVAAAVLTVPAPPPLEIAALAWERDTVPDDSTVTLEVVARNWEGRAAGLEAWRMWDDTTRAAVPLDSLGLPAVVPLTGDTTHVVWTARWLREGPDTTVSMRLVVRTLDSAAVAPVLTVLCPPVYRVLAVGWDRDSVADDSLARLAIVAENWSGQVVRLLAWRLGADSSRTALPADSLGLPETVALTADTTWVAWTARWLAEGADTTVALRLAVELADSLGAAGPLTVLAPPPLVIAALGWDRDTVANGGAATLAIVASGWRDRAVSLVAERVRADSSRVPTAADTLGLPGMVALSGDTTLVPWTARWLRDGPDTTIAMRLAVRVAGREVEASSLTVLCPPVYRVLAVGWDRDSVADDSLARLAIVAENWSGQVVRLLAWRLDDEGARVSVPADSLGLPEVPLSADTTRAAWTARWLRYGVDSTRALRLVVAPAGDTLAAPVLAIGSPPPLALDAMGWDSLLARAGSTVTLWIAARHTRGHAIALEAWRDGGLAPPDPLALEDLGLPAVVPLTGDTTRVPWTAVWLPAGTDSSLALRLRLEVGGASVVAPWLVVLGAQLPPAGVEEGAGVGRDALVTCREGGSWALDLRLVAPLGAARLELYDTQGRRVRRLFDGALPAGRTRLRWDGCDGGGGRAAPGLYFARLASPRFTATTRLLLLR
jgi:hypothetical protein